MRVDLRSRLKANSAITEIVGTAIDWNRRTGIPAIVLYNISPGRAYTFNGATGLHGARIQFDCMSLDLVEAEALFDALLVQMEREETVGATQFSTSFLDSQRDMTTVDIDGLGPVGGISADFIVWWKAV